MGPGRVDACLGGSHLVDCGPEEVLWSADAQVGVVSNLQCALPGTFREPAQSVGLNAPGNAPHQELLMVGAGLLTENLAVSVFQLPGGEVPEPLDFGPKFG